MDTIKTILKTYLEFKAVKVGAKLLALGSAGYVGYRLYKNYSGDSSGQALQT